MTGVLGAGKTRCSLQCKYILAIFYFDLSYHIALFSQWLTCMQFQFRDSTELVGLNEPSEPKVFTNAFKVAVVYGSNERGGFNESHVVSASMILRQIQKQKISFTLGYISINKMHLKMHRLFPRIRRLKQFVN